MKWELLARHKRQCPKCEYKIVRVYKNNFSQQFGRKCSNKDCDFFITNKKLKEIAPTKKQLLARKLST